MPDIYKDDDSYVKAATYGSGSNDIEVILYAIENGRHNFPGSKTPSLKFLLGNRNNDIAGRKTIWGFFNKHTKK